MTKTTAFTLSVTLALTVATPTITPAGTGKGVTLYADGQMGGNCTSGNYSITNRNCTGKDGNAYGTANGLQAANNAATAGDTILVRSFAGTYTGSGEFGAIIPKPGSSINNRTTIQGFANEIPTVRAFDSTTHPSGTTFMVFKQLLVDSGNILESTGFFGPFSFSRIENVEIRNSGGQGILGMDRAELINLNVHHNGFNSIQCKAAPSQCHGIYANEIGLIDGGEYHHNEGYGIHCYTGCKNTTIRNVRVHHNGAAGMIVAFLSAVVVHNVVADNNKGVGIWMAANGAVGSNLTAYNNGLTGILISNFNNQTVKDSISVNNGDNIGFREDVSSATLSNNLCNVKGLGCAVVANPSFVDAANGNFQLDPTSTLNGVGANLSSLTY